MSNTDDMNDIVSLGMIRDEQAKRIEELEAKLAKAVEVAEKSIKWLRLYGADVHREAATLAELTGWLNGEQMTEEEFNKRKNNCTGEIVTIGLEEI